MMEETLIETVVESNINDDDDFESIFSPKARENPVYIDDLVDAVEIDVDARLALFKPKPGEQVVVEKWFNGRWLGTDLYTVRSVDMKTGDVVLHDDEHQQAAFANFITGTLKYGWRFKLPVKGLNLNKREAPRPEPTRSFQEPKKPEVDESGQPVPKRKGRPKGSKNRSSQEIAADKARRAGELRAKKEARLAKKSGRM